MLHRRIRRLVRYSLRTFLIVSTVFCISLAPWSKNVVQKKVGVE